MRWLNNFGKYLKDKIRRVGDYLLQIAFREVKISYKRDLEAAKEQIEERDRQVEGLKQRLSEEILHYEDYIAGLISELAESYEREGVTGKIVELREKQISKLEELLDKANVRLSRMPDKNRLVTIIDHQRRALAGKRKTGNEINLAFEAFQKHKPDSIILANYDGSVIFAGDNAKELLGKEMRGDTFYDSFQGPEQEVLDSLYSDAYNGGAIIQTNTGGYLKIKVLETTKPFVVYSVEKPTKKEVRELIETQKKLKKIQDDLAKLPEEVEEIRAQSRPKTNS